MTHALIIGGGIAGPVTAMALRKAGIDSVVYEAYPTGADDVGAFLTLMSNGQDALRAIGVYEQVADQSFPASKVEFLSGTGKYLGEVPLWREGVLGPRTLKRATLYRVLQDELAARDIRIEHGKRLTGARNTSDGGVVATFADGDQAKGDLLIGADGIHSVTRALIDETAPRPRHLGNTTICGYAENAPSPAPDGTYRMVYGKRAFFGYVTAPNGETWWFTNAPGAELSKADLAGIDAEEWKARALELFAKDNTPASDIVRATGADVTASNAYHIPSTPVWHAGSMMILGDAAHVAAPNAGQGASMAAEDGVTLARCLRDVAQIGDAFRAYEGLRRERVERVVATSARMGGTAVAGPLKRMVRDAVLPRVLKKGPRNNADWLTKHHIDWEARVSLDDAVATN